MLVSPLPTHTYSPPPTYFLKMVFETETASTESYDDKVSSSPTTLGNLREKLARALSPSSTRTNPKQGAASADERG